MEYKYYVSKIRQRLGYNSGTFKLVGSHFGLDYASDYYGEHIVTVRDKDGKVIPSIYGTSSDIALLRQCVGTVESLGSIFIRVFTQTHIDLLDKLIEVSKTDDFKELKKLKIFTVDGFNFDFEPDEKMNERYSTYMFSEDYPIHLPMFLWNTYNRNSDCCKFFNSGTVMVLRTQSGSWLYKFSVDMPAFLAKLVLVEGVS